MMRKRKVAGQTVTVERRKGGAPTNYSTDEAANARRDEVQLALRKRRKRGRSDMAK